ncbi:MAG: adenylate/guanylate cyclase domain-containing protein [Pedosphaera sp.]|nr:adenylate/guanylate cyclase domain-containing protein [Pedosphaera sp.]
MDREFYLGAPSCYADIRVASPGQSAYFIEVKIGYSRQRLIEQLSKKFKQLTPELADANRVLLVVDSHRHPDWAEIEALIREQLHSSLTLEVWDENRLLELIRARFGLAAAATSTESLLDVREAVDRAKGYHAFGGESLEAYEDDALRSQPNRHFSHWRLRRLWQSRKCAPRDVFPPGVYPQVAVLMADMCSFSSYVRDTPDQRVTRNILTAFYTRARHQILNYGGMLYEFAGDSVIGFFGVPDGDDDYMESSLAAAQSLISIGKSISTEWQRSIDRIQPSSGLHLGLTVGDLQIVSYRPFSRTHFGAIGDTINLAARLMANAGSGELVVSNMFYNQLSAASQAGFEGIPPIDAKNMGKIKA